MDTHLGGGEKEEEGSKLKQCVNPTSEDMKPHIIIMKQCVIVQELGESQVAVLGCPS